MQINEDKLNALLERMVAEFGALASAPLVILGDRLGLYKAMAGAGPMTVDQFSDWRDFFLFLDHRTGRVTAFASDLHVTRPGIAAGFTAVFFATFHYAGAGNVGAGLLLRCCHNSLLHSPGMTERSPL